MASFPTSHKKKQENDIVLPPAVQRVEDLWVEVAILRKVLIRNRNQHRREEHFQAAWRLTKRANELKKAWTTNFASDTGSCKAPNARQVLWRAARLTIQVRTLSERAFLGGQAQLSQSLFVPFNVFLVSSLSSVWSCTSSLLKLLCESFAEIQRQSSSLPCATGSVIPDCLQLWVCEKLENNDLEAPFTHKTCQLCTEGDETVNAASSTASGAFTGQKPLHSFSSMADDCEDIGEPISRDAFVDLAC
eukprot:scpid81048/ scgid23329/ 